MPTRAVFTIEDYSNERTSTKTWVQDIGAGNYAAVTQDIDEIKDSIATVILGEVRSAGFSKSFPESAADVTDPVAQRELKWLVVMRDTTQFLDVGNTIANPGYGKAYTFEVGTANPALLVPNTDLMDVSQAPGDAFVTSMEANTRSPYNHTGNAPTQVVEDVVLVGRAT